MRVIGLDVGTSGVKSTVFDERANVLAHAYREYDLIGREKGEYELDPRVLLASARAVIEQSARGVGDVRAICVTSFGESFVCLDERDEPLGNTMIYMDKRGSEACEAYLQLHTREQVFERSGQFVDPMFSIYKLHWLRAHRPEQMAATRRICFIADYIAYSLGAEHACDYSLAARSGMFDVREKRWIDEAVAFSGLSARCLPR
ncbi:MAG: FGGY family carbohydrate kinase, partial [Eubacteriales bacterium]|nr:FGGY family carbohydrate kinase [Eubacteriales bacterium]